MNLKKIEYMATSLSIIGALLNALLIWICFIIWIFANILWIYVGYKKQLNGMILTFIVFTITSLMGLYIWK